jgi:rhamnosyltransferase
VPTLNAGNAWNDWLAALKSQTLQPTCTLVIDSSSTDDTPALARAAGLSVVTITRSDFNHGGTRQWAVEHLGEFKTIVFLTQDALLHTPDALEKLLSALDAQLDIGAVYGRQLPHYGATPIEAHARLFNYPAHSALRSLDDRAKFGIKTAFFSNSFAAYRRAALNDIGGFRRNLILGEDTVAAGQMLLADWRIAYCAEAQVRHSHHYSLRAEMARYFDIGVLHSREDWMLQQFGRAEGEGLRFIRSEIAYLARHAPWLIPEAGLRTLLKYTGYRLGRSEQRLSTAWKRRLSMQPGYWRDDAAHSA